MVMQADFSGLFRLGQAFGPEGIKTVLDVTETAIAAGTEAAALTLRECLKRAWPRSSITRNVRTRLTVNPRNIVGVVSVSHRWVEPLVEGRDVKSHRIPKSGSRPMVLRVGKGGERKIDPRTGKPPVRRVVQHPGYKGKDCATPAVNRGERVIKRRIERAVLQLARKLARG